MLRANCRGDDFAFRYGGDEFVILLPQTSKENATMVARRLHKLIREKTWLTSEGPGVHITSSMGVACYPDRRKIKAELLHLADEAMYLVKNTTRDNVAAANDGVLPRLGKRLIERRAAAFSGDASVLCLLHYIRRASLDPPKNDLSAVERSWAISRRRSPARRACPTKHWG